MGVLSPNEQLLRSGTKISNLYRSKHYSAVKEQYNSAKSPIPLTMGYARTPLKSPKEFLKKHSTQSQKQDEPKTERIKCVACQSRKSESKESSLSKPQKTLHILKEDCRRDFVQENVLQAIKRPNTTPVRRITDNRKGDVFLLEESGWIPKYSQKQDYGKIPPYIHRIKQNLNQSQKEFKKFITAEYAHKEPQVLTAEEKKQILEGLVKNFKILFNKYQTLPLHTCTPARINRKIELERQMDELQKDIDLIQGHEDVCF
ncbi:enkurin [Nephila pilipes]|uniref:Enkurin n=1 Tax=Nephila pilipes TaxID=299642 RepID=A0A8X6U8P5_NEPPI|nr:enkurin [Nephila pilipes]